MARNLQKPTGGGPGSDRTTTGWLTVVAAVAVAAAGCGPVEPEPRTNDPPYIGEVVPPQSIVDVSGQNTEETITAVQLYDPDREDSLSVRWLSDRRGFLSDTNSNRVRETTLNGRRFHQFEEVSVTIDLCAPDDQLSGRETVWLYVSDRDIEQSSDGTVRPGAGGYLVSHSWVFEYTCT